MSVFPHTDDDEPIMEAFNRTRRLARGEGFVPVPIAVNETFWERLVMNSDPDNNGRKEYRFDPKVVATYREKHLSQPIPDSKTILGEWIKMAGRCSTEVCHIVLLVELRRSMRYDLGCIFQQTEKKDKLKYIPKFATLSQRKRPWLRT